MTTVGWDAYNRLVMNYVADAHGAIPAPVSPKPALPEAAAPSGAPSPGAAARDVRRDPDPAVRLVWHGQRIKRMIFASGKTVEFRS